VSHRLGIVCETPAALGFETAGLRPRVVDAAAAATVALQEMIDEGGWGIVLVQEELVEAGPAAALRRTTGGVPIIIPFPGPSLERPPGEAERYVTELLRQAIGYRVRLR
jgi:V/A-type H+-transporting ATPase subunit F